MQKSQRIISEDKSRIGQVFEYMTVIIYLLPNCFSSLISPSSSRCFGLNLVLNTNLQTLCLNIAMFFFIKGSGGGGEATHEQNKILRPLGGSRILRDRMISEDVFPWMLRPLPACL